MADLSVTYSKTPKGLRARSSLIGGLSGKLFKVLSFIDGISKAQTILTKYDDITADKLLIAISKLESEGYIKPTAASVFDEDDWDFDTVSDIVVAESLPAEEQTSESKQADKALAALELVRQQELAEQAEKARLAEVARQTEKSQQQLALIKAIEIAKAQTKIQEKIDIEQAAAAQKKLKLESLTKIKAEQLRAARAQAEQSLNNTAVQQLAAENAAELARDSAAQQLALEKSAKAKLAVDVEQAREEKLRLAAVNEAKKAEKVAQVAQKVAFAESEQLRLMAEFEENIKTEAAAAQQVERAELAAAAKLILKAKAEARAKAEFDAIALKNAAQKVSKS